ncbi:MAG: SRPBCC family protein [Phycisphaerales bacterium]|nr:SRPBCC family protein [Phycisphaerales bacterium]
MHISRHINAPADVVFDAISDPDTFAQVVPEIDRIEYVTEKRREVGARFRETRTMRGRQATAELEIADFVPGQRIRLTSEAGGSLWDSTFTVEPEGDGASTLTLDMQVTPRRLAARLTNPLIMGMIRKAIEKDMNAIKSWCERG